MKVLITFPLTFATTMKCDFRNYEFEHVGVLYTCWSPVLTGTKDTNVTEVVGHHLEGKTDADVKGYYMYKKHALHQIPRILGIAFPNLVLLGHVHGNLKNLSADDLKPFSDLQHLLLSSNQLKTLQGDLLKHNPKLSVINFSNNQIESVGLGLLDNLNRLASANFFNNYCINFHAKGESRVQELKQKLKSQCAPSRNDDVVLHCFFGDFEWLVVNTRYTCHWAYTAAQSSGGLSIVGNQQSGRTNDDVEALYVNDDPLELKTIPRGIEDFFPFLMVFAWSTGHLTTLTADDLKPFSFLLELSFFNNKIISLDGDLFTRSTYVEFLNFGKNQIKDVGYGFLDGLNMLTYASFKDNDCIDMAALEPAAITELRMKLQNQCQKSFCSVGCRNAIDAANREISTLKKEIAKMRAEVGTLSDSFKKVRARML